MHSWRERFQIIATTVLLTSLVWLVVGFVVFSRLGDRSAPQIAIALPSASPQPLLATSNVNPAPGALLLPVQGVRAEQLVDTWGQSRAGGARTHEAIDIIAPRGTPVLAAAPGVVEKLFHSVRGGTTIYLRSPDRQVIYYYAHLDRYAPGLAEKQQVRAGQVIGYVGSTGDASPDGPHLHFAINLARPDESWWQGHAVNPYPLLRAGRLGP
jgi:murein DD-endopeptidase MepM/ murein hydrolase activator NlpD